LTDYSKLREEMVERQIAARGIKNPLVLRAMRSVPREMFLTGLQADYAYDDRPLPLEAGQTISQPYIVAAMIEGLNLKGGEHVLEVGTGSGYAAAVLSRIAGQVITVERIAELADSARALLADLHYDNVIVRHGDGSKGCREFSPYDAIIVAASGPDVPASLREQLKMGGRLVMPVGKDRQNQKLIRVTKLSQDEYVNEAITDVRFVPLIGQEGWSEGND
jgi:protein-L-isoaspartate(D-aspartate) O-methyltransferase